MTSTEHSRSVLQFDKLNAPQLRFPEFVEPWENKKLEEIAEVKSGGTPRRGKKEYWNGNIPWVTTSLLNRDEIWNTDEFITKEGLDNSSAKIFPVNTILMAMYGQGKTRGMVSNLKIKASTNQACAALILNNLVDNEFIFQSLKNKYKTLRNLSNEGGQKNLSSGLIRKFKYAIPNSLPEQTKIATFLTAVDKRINLLQKKKAELEQYKKGVMQKLFSQTIRFKKDDGSDFADWEEKTLGELYSFKTTNSYSRDKLNYKIQNVKNIHYGDIHTKFNSHFDIEKENVPFINLDVDISKIPDENFLQQGDLIIADASEDYADIGKTIEIVNLNGEKVLAGLHTLLARRKDYELVIGFVSHLLKTYYVRLDIMRIAQGTKVLSVSTKRLSNVVVRVPCIKEQQKTANFLSSIDKSIEKMGNQIDDSVVFKQGLLQKMFV